MSECDVCLLRARRVNVPCFDFNELDRLNGARRTLARARLASNCEHINQHSHSAHTDLYVLPMLLLPSLPLSV